MHHAQLAQIHAPTDARISNIFRRHLSVNVPSLPLHPLFSKTLPISSNSFLILPGQHCHLLKSPQPAGGRLPVTMVPIPILFLFFFRLSHSLSHQSHPPHKLSIQNRILFDVIPDCVPSGDNHILSNPKTQTCPCFVSFGLSSPSSSDVVVDFFIIPTSSFTTWSSNNFSGPPPYLPQFSVLNASATAYSFVYGFFFFQTENIDLPISDDFTFVTRTSSPKQDCVLDVMYIFQSQPSPCPERLPAPSDPQHSSISNTPRVQPRVQHRPRQSFNTPEFHVVAGTSVTDPTIRRYMASIRSSAGACSGTVIGDYWILTAAHCQVRVGGRAHVNGDTTESGTLHQIVEFIAHPEYSLSTDGLLEEHDIAVVRVSEPIVDGKAVMLNTRMEGPTDGLFVRASGYGQIAEGWVGGPVRQLLQVDMPVVGFRECVKAFVRWGASEFARSLTGKGHLCVGFLNGDCGGDTCYGDSGGPVVVRDATSGYVQVGVVSGGIGCAREGLPGIYTRVGRYFEWVRQVTNSSVVGVEISGGGPPFDDEDVEEAVQEAEDEVIQEAVRGVPKTGLVVAGVAGAIGVLLAAFLVVFLVGRRREPVAREEATASRDQLLLVGGMQKTGIEEHGVKARISNSGDHGSANGGPNVRFQARTYEDASASDVNA